jgi:hypothetical protein
MTDENIVEGTAKAIAELAKAVPIYQDALQPGAKEVGKALGSVGRAGNAVLSPISEMVVWGVDQLRPFFQRIATKLEATPPEHINSTPKANVIVPALEAVRLTESEVDLQELYANLIASAMDKRVAHGVFPSFVEILKQLTSDEAKLLRTIMSGIPVPIVHIQQEIFDDNGRRISGLDVVKNRSLIGGPAGCVYPKQVPSYLDNLARLGIIQFHAPGTSYADKSVYREVELDPENLTLRGQYEQPPRYRSKYVHTGLELTTFGRHFINACVRPYGSE